MLETEHLESFPPGNPFHHDLVRMGVRIGSNVIAMMDNFDHDMCTDVIIVNTETGERLRIWFKKD